MTRKLGQQGFEKDAAQLATIMNVTHPAARAVSLMQAVPALRGLWPCGPCGASGELVDVQGLGNHLSVSGSPRFDYSGIIPNVRYDGTGDYHSISDAASSNAFDITGTDTYTATTKRGLTCWSWIYPEETGTLEYVIYKWGAAGDRAYRLYLDASDQFDFSISDDGTNNDTATSAAVSMDAWYFVVGRFEPSTTVDVIVNDTEVNQATARASIFDGSSAFTIGASSAGSSEFQGRVAFAGIAAAYLSDGWCSLLYQQTRGLFGR